MNKIRPDELACGTQQSLAETNAALKTEPQVNAFYSSIINTVSHEYRTPLTNIILGVQMLKKYHGELDGDRQMHFLSHIENAAKYLTQLVDNMLHVGQAEAGKLQFHPVYLNLSALCLSIIEDLKLLCTPQHTLTFISECESPAVYVDICLMRQILTNLLVNAIKYSPNGGEVHLHLTYQQGQAIFKIQDQGIGIPQADYNQVFDRFNRGSNTNTIKGTGLGLAIVKKCVELHGGDIWFESQVDLGTTFYVQIPC